MSGNISFTLVKSFLTEVSIFNVISKKVSLSQIQVLLLHHCSLSRGTKENSEGLDFSVTSSLSNKVALMVGQA
jgi:hypothetical protein